MKPSKRLYQIVKRITLYSNANCCCKDRMFFFQIYHESRDIYLCRRRKKNALYYRAANLNDLWGLCVCGPTFWICTEIILKNLGVENVRCPVQFVCVTSMLFASILYVCDFWALKQFTIESIHWFNFFFVFRFDWKQ